MTADQLRPLLRGLVMIGTLLALAWVFKASGLAHMLDTGWVDHEIRGHGVQGWLLFVALGTASITVGLPRQLVCFLAGYAAGLGPGLALAQLASISGCILSFSYARLIGRDFVRRRFPERLAWLDRLLAQHPMTMTMMVRFLPVGSNLVTSLMGGVCSVPALPFFLGSFIGYLPQSLVFVLLGSGIHLQPGWRIGISVALFLLSAALGIFLLRRLRSFDS